MRIHIIANFPYAFESYFSTSMMRIAQEKKCFTPVFYNLGDYSMQAQHRVDDKPYGGWAGALLQVEPIYRALIHIDPNNTFRKFYLWPRGTLLKQEIAETLSQDLAWRECIVLCGHYEWVDQRVLEIFSFEQYSIGEYVVSSGELAAMVFIDTIVRLIPGVLGNNDSLHEESFSPALDRRIEYPQYTRPAEFMGYNVPEELLSGDPKKIQAWRKKFMA